VDATNFPGVYEIHIADARFAVANSTQLLISIQCTGVAPVYVEYQLVVVDLMNGVHFGLTALPNTAVTTNGSLITSGTGTAQLSVTSGNVSVGTIATNAITAASINADAITAAKIATGAIDADAIAADAITSAKIADSAITIRLATDGTASEARIVTGVVASDIWNALLADYTTVNTFGARVVRTIASPATNEVSINASNHLAANVHQMQNNTITAAAIATDAIDADALATDAVTEIAAGTLTYDISAFSTVGQAGTYLKNAMPTFTYTAPPTAVANADALLGRNLAGGSDGGRMVKDALRVLRNKTSITASTLTVYQEDDGLSLPAAWTATLSTSASADPVTGIDPV
jgi:hypothetical protein